MRKNFNNIIESLRPLSAAQEHYYPAAAVDYLRYYGLDMGGGEISHLFGYIETDCGRLAAHIYRPRDYKAVFFISHGYFSHSGLAVNLLSHLLAKGFAAAVFDLPGHGISQGARCEIDDFSRYSAAIEGFVAQSRPFFRKPYHFIGHSTGASAAIELMLDGRGDEFERVVLAAPLVRCAAWEKSKMGYSSNIPFVTSVPRVFRKNSSNGSFVRFVRYKDPLQCRVVPLSWVRAMHRWELSVAGRNPSSRHIEIIQGTVDNVVDWQYNTRWLHDKFPNARTTMIEGANHELFNESPQLCEIVLKTVTQEQ